jgi:2',3'-cyclic-nucleotide 2'-phosphodiesterase (5'-nucleotidase family)
MLPRARGQAEVLVEAYNRIGCAGLNVGDRDLAAGRAELEALRARANFPFLSANLLDPATQQPIFAPFVVAEVAGQRIGLIGLLSARTALVPPEGGESEFTIGDPAQAARAAVQALANERVVAILLLSQLLDDEVAAVIAAAPEIDVVLGSQNPSFASMLGETAGRPHATSQMRGQHLGVLSLFVQPGSRGVVERGRAASIVAAVGSIDQRIRQQEAMWARFADMPNVQPQRIAYFKQDIARQLRERQQLVAELAQVKPVDPNRSFVEFELVPMGRNVAEEPDIKALTDGFKATGTAPARAGRGAAAATGTRAGGAEPAAPAPARRRRASGTTP